MDLTEELRKIIKKFLESFINSETLVSILLTIVMIIFWILLAYIITRIVKVLVLRTKKFEQRVGDRENKQQLTIRRLVNNIIKAVFIFWIVVMILKEIGIDVMPLLAGAGVIAFAVGFGAQELIKDVISGFFIIIEKTLSIGDYVEIGGKTGTVLEVGIRRTTIVTWKGEVFTVNNGDIRQVMNFSINPSVAVIDFVVGYDFDIEHFNEKPFRDFLETFKNENENVLEIPATIPVVSLVEGVKLTVIMKTVTRRSVAVEREFRKKLVEYFRENNFNLDVPKIFKVTDEKKDIIE